MAIQGFLHGFAATPANAQVLDRMVAVVPGSVRMVLAVAASSGGSPTVLDVLLNGSSVWTVVGNRPTLAASQTGRFTSGPINRSAVQDGDVLQLIVVSAGGAGQVSATVALEDPSQRSG